MQHTSVVIFDEEYHEKGLQRPVNGWRMITTRSVCDCVVSFLGSFLPRPTVRAQPKSPRDDEPGRKHV